MKKRPTKNRRPGILVRFYPQDLELLNRHCQEACTPRENFIRRSVLASIRAAALGQPAMPVDPEQMTLAEIQPQAAAIRRHGVKFASTPKAARLTRPRNRGKKSTAA